MVPPRARLSGTQLAGWSPRTQSAPRYDVACEPDIPVRLPDGTVLRGDLYRPKGSGPVPALLAWSSYTRGFQHTGLPLPINEVGVVSYFVSRGYAHLTVNARGTGRSGGARTFMHGPQEQRDVANTVEWTAEQPWCDGNVGMIGMSYFAVVQYLAAAQRPPHLKAIFPYLGWTDFYRHLAYHGGAFHADFFAFYYALVGATQRVALPPRLRHVLGYWLDHPGLQRLATRLFLPLRPVMAARLHPEASWMHDYAALAFDQRTDGPFYAEKSAWPVLDRIEIPVCLGTNWGNPGLHTFGAFEAWARIRAPKKLFVGPPEPTWPWETYQEEALAWYDQHLKGLDTGVMDQPPVRYWLQGAERWCIAADWPVPGTLRQRLYLAARSDGARQEQALQAQPPTDSPTLSFVAIPRGMLYPRGLDVVESQSLRYVSEPFPRDTEVVGPLTAHLMVASTALDTHVVVRVSDRGPDGRVRKLAYGWLQAAYRDVDRARSRPDEVVHDYRRPEALVPGEPVELTISLNPAANLFRTGHRLVLDIGSRPDLLAPSTLADGFVYFSYDAPPYPARNTIFHGGPTPSLLEFTVRDR